MSNAFFTPYPCVAIFNELYICNPRSLVIQHIWGSCNLFTSINIWPPKNALAQHMSKFHLPLLCPIFQLIYIPLYPFTTFFAIYNSTIFVISDAMYCEEELEERKWGSRVGLVSVPHSLQVQAVKSRAVDMPGWDPSSQNTFFSASVNLSKQHGISTARNIAIVSSLGNNRGNINTVLLVSPASWENIFLMNRG